jgi:membrane-bound lytic murein transglycosylase B
MGLPAAAAPNTPAPAWSELVERLRQDGLYSPAVANELAALPQPSPTPMGRKIKELYFSRYVRPTLPPQPKKPEEYLYRGVVAPENASACRAFIKAHKAAFRNAESVYGVPADIAAALLFVETRLGAAPGKNNVFRTLAGMAATRRPEQLTPAGGRIDDQLGLWLDDIQQSPEKTAWLEETLRKRSDWAYRELAAFIRYAAQNGLDPFHVPGSVYGAFGICQFMPSSVAAYAADGDGDGVIDLFSPEDALASLASYLAKNGWRLGISRHARHAALRRYNRADVYANTILALADMIRGAPVGKPIVTARSRKKKAE